MTPALLTRAGHAMFGPDYWQAPLARLLCVNDRTMRRWVAGDNPIPAGVWGDCQALLKARRIEIDEILAEV